MKDYYQLLEDVRKKSIESFMVEVEEFPSFHKIWQMYPYQNQIRGEASRGGTIKYERQSNN